MKAAESEEADEPGYIEDIGKDDSWLEGWTFFGAESVYKMRNSEGGTRNPDEKSRTDPPVLKASSAERSPAGHPGHASVGVLGTQAAGPQGPIRQCLAVCPTIKGLNSCASTPGGWLQGPIQPEMKTIKSLRLDGLLSFAPGSDPFELQPLNVFIGPNGSGKSNIVEAFELLRAAPANFAEAIRDGGGPAEWLWKGSKPANSAVLETVLDAEAPTGRPLRYRLEFGSAHGRVEILDEAIEETEPQPGQKDVYFYYRFQRGDPVMNVKTTEGRSWQRRLQRDTLAPGESVLAQRKDPEAYPEVTWAGKRLAGMQTFREWSFGRYAPLRQPQPVDLDEDQLLPDSRNLALLLNQIEHKDGHQFNQFLRRFFPRFDRMSTKLSGGTVQFYIHEKGFRAPIPATRLSDGTIRFVAVLATLLAPKPPPLVCIEEPELGLHPDALALIADLLVQASQQMQLVVTTHSDALVSGLGSSPDAVVACERPGEATELHRLDPGQLESWLNDYSLGDLWRMGELGANP